MLLTFHVPHVAHMHSHFSAFPPRGLLNINTVKRSLEVAFALPGAGAGERETKRGRQLKAISVCYFQLCQELLCHSANISRRLPNIIRHMFCHM